MLFQTLFIDSEVLEQPVAKKILRHSGRIPVEVVDKARAKSIFRHLSLSKGKRVLYVTRFSGDMVKPCPATAPPYLCCRYTVINQVLQCPMDCSYCILQGYLESPVVTLFANVDSAFQNIDRFLSEQPDRLFRFGTGELGDSLALDELTGLSECTIGFFSGKRNAILELKTKTDRIGRLIALKPKNTVVSWSLNPQSVIDREEFRSAPLLARLKAARKCQDAGYLLGFHFDPVLFYRGWEEEYKDVVRRIFQHVEGSRIAWISLGTLRFPPALKEIIQERFPKSRIVCEEMIRGLDGKMRYPRPRRIEMFKVLYCLFKANQPELFVYFCMEHPAVWDAVTGSHPESNAELDFWFARSLFERFPELTLNKPKMKK